MSATPPHMFEQSEEQNETEQETNKYQQKGCPVCGVTLSSLENSEINYHIDLCLGLIASDDNINTPASHEYIDISDSESPSPPPPLSDSLNSEQILFHNNNNNNNNLNNNNIFNQNFDAATDIYEEVPTTVSCPLCFGFSSDVPTFAAHLASFHSLSLHEQISVACPICTLTITHSHQPASLLLEHITSDHVDFFDQCSDIPAEVLLASILNTSQADLPISLTGEYVVIQIKTHNISMIQGECPICFEDFDLHQHVARLDCLCIYHEPCIQAWYSRKSAKTCPHHPT